MDCRTTAGDGNPVGIRSRVGEAGNGSQTVIPKSVHLLRKMCHIPETTQGTVKTVLLHFLGKQFRWERVLLHS